MCASVYIHVFTFGWVKSREPGGAPFHQRVEVILMTRGPWALTFCLRTNLAIDLSSRSCTYTLFLSLFSLSGQCFLRYGLIFKIAIFGHQNLAIGQSLRSCKYDIVLPQGVEIELYLFTEILADFHICHIWAWNLAIGQSSRSCTHTSYTTPESKISLCFALRLAISKILAIFHFPIGHNVKFQSFFF